MDWIIYFYILWAGQALGLSVKRTYQKKWGYKHEFKGTAFG
jgi:hypothetical protein